MRRKRGRTKAEQCSEWTEKNGRDVVRDRSSGVCEGCGCSRAAEWQHRKNRSQGGGWNPANGLHLCTPCHAWIHANPTAAVERGWTVPEHLDPADVPVEHWQWGRVHLDDHGGIHLVQKG